MNFWHLLSDPEFQATISWIGGGIAALATALWAVIRARKTTPPSGGVNVSGRDGIVSGGSVNFTGRISISRGVPAWVILLGFAGLLLLGLRLLAALAGLTPLPAAEARDLISGSAVAIDQREEAFIGLFKTNGGIEILTLRGGLVHRNGTWRVREDGAICVAVSGSAVGSGCYFLMSLENRRWLSAENSGPPLGDLLVPGTASIEAGDALQGRWEGRGYACGPDRLVEVVEVSARGDDLMARKITGDDCIAAGEITWRGALKSGFIEVDGHGRGADGKSVWYRGRISVLNEDLMVWETYGWNEQVIFRRLE